MVDVRPALHYVGIILCVLAAFMLVPVLAELVRGQGHWSVFLLSGGMTAFCGLGLVLGTRSDSHRLTLRQLYLTLVLGWVVPVYFAALPFMFGPHPLSTLDALFEATSGLTTTGMTVIGNLDHADPGQLMWRSLLNWLGGIGVVVCALAVLPHLTIGGMQVFRVEMPQGRDRAMPGILRIGILLGGFYLGATFVLALFLWLAGMSRFDAAAHAMSIISSGGFSTHDASLAFYANGWVDAVAWVGMVISGLPFILFFHGLRGNWRRLWLDQQVRLYVGLMALGGFGLSLWLADNRGFTVGEALHHGLLTATSILSGNGMSSLNYSDWVGLPAAILFFMTIVGACAGSAGSGFKIFRLHMLFVSAVTLIRQLLQPHAVVIATFNRRHVPEDVLESVLGFLFITMLVLAGLSLALAFVGLDFISALSASASALSNVGSGLGELIGPGGDSAPLPDSAKLILMTGMIFGRLEMLPLLVLFVPTFWKQ